MVVDFSNKFKGLGRQRFQVSGAGHARIGDEAVQGAELQDGFAHERLHAVQVGDIGFEENGPVAAADRVEGGGGLLAGHLVQVGHDDVGALADQFARDAFAEALGGARHDDGLALHATLVGAGGDLAAVILNLPVVDEGDLAAVHRMRPAEGSGVPGDLDGVQEDIRDDLGVLGAVTGGQQADARDEEYLGRVAAAGDVSLDGLFGGIRIRTVEQEVFALAIDDAVRGEGRLDSFPTLHRPLGQGVGSDLDGLEAASGTTQHGAHGGHEVHRLFVDRHISFRDRLHACFELGHDAVVDAADLIGRVGAHEDAVVLEEDDLRLGAVVLPPGLDAVVHLLEQGVAGIGVFDVEGLGEEVRALGLGELRAHHPVHERGMEMDDVAPLHAVVQGGLDRRTAALGEARDRQVVLDLLLAHGGVAVITPAPHRGETLAVEDRESAFVDGREGVAAGLDPKLVGVLVRSVAAAGDHKTRIGAVLAGYFNQCIQFFHASIVFNINSSPAAGESSPA